MKCFRRTAQKVRNPTIFFWCLFIGELFTRRLSEIELWPSQIEATRRSTDLGDDFGGGASNKHRQN